MPRRIIEALLIISIIFFVYSACFGQSETDPCEAIVPSKLREAILARYPAYRIALITDYDAETIKEQIGYHPHHPCLAVASADVDGDGSIDYALFITDSSGHTLLIAARSPHNKSWQISKLYDFPRGELGSSYVTTLEPGDYEDLFTYQGNFKPEPGGVRRFKSKHPGFLAGTIESSGVAFFFSGKRWVHLWLSD